MAPYTPAAILEGLNAEYAALCQLNELLYQHEAISVKEKEAARKALLLLEKTCKQVEVISKAVEARKAAKG